MNAILEFYRDSCRIFQKFFQEALGVVARFISEIMLRVYSGVAESVLSGAPSAKMFQAFCRNSSTNFSNNSITDSFGSIFKKSPKFQKFLQKIPHECL